MADIYIDILFLVNFTMDAVLLWILRRLLRLHTSPLKLLLGAAAGAGWACLLVLLPGMPALVRAAGTYVGAAVLMAGLAFAPGTLKMLLKEVAGLYAAAAILGGLGTFFYWHTPAGFYLEMAVRGHPAAAVPLAAMGFAAAGGYFTVRYIRAVLNGRRPALFRVILKYRGRENEVTALLDTGNRLFEPATGKPVSVISRRAAEKVCPTVEGVIYVPYRSVGRRHGILPAVQLDAMEVFGEELHMAVQRPLVGISGEMLSEDGSFDMLLNEKSLDRSHGVRRR